MHPVHNFSTGATFININVILHHHINEEILSMIYLFKYPDVQQPVYHVPILLIYVGFIFNSILSWKSWKVNKKEIRLRD